MEIKKTIIGHLLFLLGIFYVSIQFHAMDALHVIFINENILPSSSITHLSALCLLGDISFLFASGFLIDKYTAEKILLLSLACIVLLIFQFAVIKNTYWMYLNRLFTGVCISAIFLSCIKLASTTLKKSINLFFGTLGIATMLGGTVVHYPFLVLSEKIGWRGAIFTDGIASLIVLLFFTIYFLNFTRPRSAENSIGQQYKSHWLKTAYLNSKTWKYACYAGLINTPILILGALWGSLYFKNIYGLADKSASLITSLIYLGNMVGALILSWLSSRYIRHEKLLFICSAFGSLILAFINFGDTLPIYVLAILTFMAGFTSGCQSVVYTTVALESKREVMAMSFSIISFTSLIIGLFGQTIFQHIIAYLDQYSHTINKFKIAGSLIIISYTISAWIAMSISSKAKKYLITGNSMD